MGYLASVLEEHKLEVREGTRREDLDELLFVGAPLLLSRLNT